MPGSWFQVIRLRGELRCTRPYATVAAFREPLDYVPASQIMGLLLAVRLMRFGGRDSTLDMLEELRSIADAYMNGGVGVKFWPGLPLMEGETLELLELLREVFEGEGLLELAKIINDIEEASRELPYLLCLAPAPKLELKSGDGTKLPILRIKKAPLALIPVLFLVYKAGNILKGHERLDELKKILKRLEDPLAFRYSQGICIDRVRHVSKHGMFYAHGLSLTKEGSQICAAIEYLEAPALATERDIETLAPILSLGFKKGIGAGKLAVSAMRTRYLERGEAPSYIVDFLVRIAKRALEYTVKEEGGKAFVGILALDYVPYGLIGDLVREKPMRLKVVVHPIMLYLQLTNSFYRMYWDGSVEALAAPGSFAAFEVEDAIGALDELVRSLKEGERSLDRLQFARVSAEGESKVERNDLLSLLRFKISACNTSVIPFIAPLEVEGK